MSSVMPQLPALQRLMISFCSLALLTSPCTHTCTLNTLDIPRAPVRQCKVASDGDVALPVKHQLVVMH
jgi:hypothetical protein